MSKRMSRLPSHIWQFQTKRNERENFSCATAMRWSISWRCFYRTVKSRKLLRIMAAPNRVLTVFSFSLPAGRRLILFRRRCCCSCFFDGDGTRWRWQVTQNGFFFWWNLTFRRNEQQKERKKTCRRRAFHRRDNLNVVDVTWWRIITFQCRLYIIFTRAALARRGKGVEYVY